MYTYNFQIYRGTLFSARMIWAENSVPVDLTNWQAKATIKSTAMSAA